MTFTATFCLFVVVVVVAVTFYSCFPFGCHRRCLPFPPISKLLLFLKTYSFVASNCLAPDGKYYVTLRTLNEVQYGGPLSTTICHTTPYVIDTSPPFVYEVYGTTYDEETHVINTMYNARYVPS